ncbi:hypothetical protein HDU96_007140, partial [Phlyctochytrium bullatum]
MIRPSHIERLQYFYPAGSTPATNLARASALEGDLDLLLLGCCDVRNILFTVYSESGAASEAGMARKLDFTCCDHIAEVIARNVLLLTFIVDGERDSDMLWRIYYDIYLDDVSLEVLHEQARKVLSFAGSMESWREGAYGSIIRFCDASTLKMVANVLRIYAADPSDGAAYAKQQNDLTAMISEALKMAEPNDPLDGVRSLSPCELPAMEDISKLHKNFWKTGLTSRGQKATAEHLKPEHLNPMYVINDALALHHGQLPLLGYHLAIAVAELNEASSLRPDPKIKGLKRYAAAAKLEFGAWLNAFRAATSRIVIRFCVADALAFCHVIQFQHVHGDSAGAGWYRSTFTFESLVLDPVEYTSQNEATAAPTTFDVIDTSNLDGTLGALNLIAASSPLLKAKPHSALFMEILTKPEEKAEDYLKSLLCGDFVTIALLLGLVSVEYWTGATATARSDAVAEMANVSSGPSWFKFVWRRSERLGFKWDTAELATLLFKLYLQMFRDDDNMAHELSESDFAEPGVCQKYTRASLATILQAILNLNTVDPDKFLKMFIASVTRNSLHEGCPYIQELIVQLYL